MKKLLQRLGRFQGRYLLLKCSAQALHDIAATKLKTPGIKLSITSVLHTWSRQMQHHPHIHSIVPAIAYDPQKREIACAPSKLSGFLSLNFSAL